MSSPSVTKKTLLETNPSACLFVFGPRATGSKTCSELLESALRYLQTTRRIPFSAKRKLIAEIRKAEKHDQVDVGLRKAVKALKEIDCFSDWLQQVYPQASSTPLVALLQQLQELHKQGALLACTQLDSLPGTRQVTLHDEEMFSCWLSCGEGEDVYVNVDTEDTVPILHLCGSCTNLDTLCIKEGENEVKESSSSASDGDLKKKMKDLLQERLVIFIGLEGDTQNPFLRDFLGEYYTFSAQKVLKHPPIMIKSQKECQKRGSPAGCRKEDDIITQFLNLQVEEGETFFGNFILQGSKQNFSIARGLTDRQTDGTKYQAFLLFNEKQSFRKLGEIIYHQSRSGEIYVRRDALTVVYSSGKLLYSNIITYGGSGLRQLWRLVFADGSTLLGKGLVAFGLQNSAIVWIRGRPDELGNVVDVSTTYAGKSSLSATTVMKSMSQPSLTTSQASSAPVSWQVSTAQVQSHMASLASPVQPAAHLSAYPKDGILPPIRNIPPPPKLIKIPSSSLQDVPSSSRQEPQKQTVVNNNGKGGNRHEDSGSVDALLCSGSSTSSVENRDVKYLQAIVDLQERINQQLGSADSEAVDRVPTIDPSSSRQTPFRPPQYCMAGPPELLLDIISESRYVKQHEFTIEKMELRADNQKKDVRQPASLNRTRTASRLASSSGAVPKLIHSGSAPSNMPMLSNGDLSCNSSISWERNISLPSSHGTGALPTQPIYRNTSPASTGNPVGSPSPTYRKEHSSSPKAPSVPNYCVALNPFPIMLVNPSIPMVQQFPTAVNIPMGVATTTGLPGNQLVCYMTPNGVINPLIPQVPNEVSSTSNYQTKQDSPRQTYTPTHKEVSIPSLLHDSHSRRKNGKASLADRLSLTHVPPARGSPPAPKRLCLAAPASDGLLRKQELEASSRHQVASSVEANEEEPEGQVGSSSSFSEGPHSTLTSDGSVQLWIFLLDLLLSPDYRHIIHWTGNMYEFRIAQPAGLAKLWGSHRNKPQMTYEKMSRALRYYYSRGIIESVRGRKQTFRFSLDLQKYVSSNKDKKCLDYLKSCCHL